MRNYFNLFNLLNSVLQICAPSLLRIIHVLYTCFIYSAIQKFFNKIKYFLTISKNVLFLYAFYKQYGSKFRPNETLGLIFDPYCLIPSISFCWKLVVLRVITWIMWLYKFCKFYKLSKNFWRALYLMYIVIRRLIKLPHLFHVFDQDWWQI